jgi:hypothetical protein
LFPLIRFLPPGEKARKGVGCLIVFDCLIVLGKIRENKLLYDCLINQNAFFQNFGQNKL